MFGCLFVEADDTKMAMIVENEEDAKKLQEDIDNLTKWADVWQMHFNVGKCKVMHIGNGNKRHDYFMNGTKLEEATVEKDLGVWVHNSMKPSTQCEYAARIANVTLGKILRSFHYRKTSYLVPLYKTFVRPQLEYAAAAWSPWLQKDRDALEKVQKRLIRSLSDKRGDEYEERLKNAGLTTLQERRQRGDMIQVFKSVKGFSRVNANNWFDLKDPNNLRPTRANTMIDESGESRKSFIMNLPPCRLDIRKHFFCARVVREWNSIPEVAKNANSINEFKNLYDGFESSKNNT